MVRQVCRPVGTSGEAPETHRLRGFDLNEESINQSRNFTSQVANVVDNYLLVVVDREKRCVSSKGYFIEIVQKNVFFEKLQFAFFV